MVTSAKRPNAKSNLPIFPHKENFVCFSSQMFNTAKEEYGRIWSGGYGMLVLSDITSLIKSSMEIRPFFQIGLQGMPVVQEALRETFELRETFFIVP